MKAPRELRSFTLRCRRIVQARAREGLMPFGILVAQKPSEVEVVAWRDVKPGAAEAELWRQRILGECVKRPNYLAATLYVALTDDQTAEAALRSTPPGSSFGDLLRAGQDVDPGVMLLAIDGRGYAYARTTSVVELHYATGDASWRPGKAVPLATGFPWIADAQSAMAGRRVSMPMDTGA